MTDALVEDAPVLVESIGRVGLVTLNRPKQLNALNDALMDALGAALLALDSDDGIGVIVITGGAKDFAAGADIAAMVDWSYMDVYRSDFITRNWETIRRVRKPVIAALAGFALGAGFELALACDIVIAAESARFALPEIKLAMLPGAGGTQRLPRHRHSQSHGPVSVRPHARRAIARGHAGVGDNDRRLPIARAGGDQGIREPGV